MHSRTGHLLRLLEIADKLERAEELFDANLAEFNRRKLYNRDGCKTLDEWIDRFIPSYRTRPAVFAPRPDV